MTNIIETVAKIKDLNKTLKALEASSKKVYAIGREDNRVVAGHGDSYRETQIRPLGMYGNEGFAPLFTSEEKALEYIKNMEYPHGHVPVELILIEE